MALDRPAPPHACALMSRPEAADTLTVCQPLWLGFGLPRLPCSR
jgi:hypothetical protein